MQIGEVFGVKIDGVVEYQYNIAQIADKADIEEIGYKFDKYDELASGMGLWPDAPRGCECYNKDFNTKNLKNSVFGMFERDCVEIDKQNIEDIIENKEYMQTIKIYNKSLT